MPLKGFLSEETGERVSFDTYLTQAQLPGETLYPYEILAMMAHSQEERVDAGLSATMLTGCSRQAFWQVALDYYQKPSLLWPGVRGTLFHTLMEAYPQPGCIHETRFGRVLPNGVMITGKMDKVDPVQGLIVDYKTRREIPDELRTAYITQLNIYRWILRDAIVVTPGPVSTLGAGEHVSILIEKLGLIYLTMDSIKKIAVPLMGLPKIDAMITRKAKRYHEAMAGGPLPERIVADPKKSTLCHSWCSFYHECLKAGPT